MKKTGMILGIVSILPVIISIFVFYIERGPNVDIYFIVKIYGILSIVGILFAIFSWVMSKRLIFLVLGLLGNGFILVIAFFLLLAMGFSEP